MASMPTRLLVCASISAALCLVLGPAAIASVASLASGPANELDTARVLVHYKLNVSPETESEIEASVGAHLHQTIPDIGVRVLEVRAGARAHVEQVLRNRTEVDFVEPDGVVQPQDNLPNDPSFPANYAVGGGAWGWTMTHTTQAWDITQGDSSVVIAILDTGVKTNGLADFNGQIASTWNVMNNSSDATSNAGNHGTYVAGIVGLAINNGVGGAGICPGCKLMVVQVGTDASAYFSDIATGLTWAADHGARVANMSWAGSADSSTMQSATTYAHNKGLVMTAAAGNSNCDCVTYPAADPYVVGVAGVDSTGNKAGDSNYGNWVAMAAPEGDMTAWPSLNGLPAYAPLGGTSSAAPFVAGLAGLLVSTNPALTNTRVEQALESTGAPVTFSVAHGRVDALAAMGAVGLTDPQPATAPMNTSPASLLVETNGDWNYQPLGGAPQVGQVLLRGQGSWTGSAPLALSSVKWERCDSTGASCVVAAQAAKYTVQATDAGSTFYCLITVSNAVGATTVASSLSLPVGSTPAPSPSPSPTPSPSPSVSPSPSASPSPPTVAATQTWTFSGSLNGNFTAREYTVTVGSGTATAQLSFTKCGSMTLALSNGASSTGPSTVVLATTLSAGTYTYRVSGGRCSFTLVVSAPSG